MTRNINEIIVHCTATRPDWWKSKSSEEKVREVRDWHVSGNGWSDIGYHWLIDRDGTIVAGRAENRTGAHCRGRNSNSIGISLFGGHGSGADDMFDEHFTPEQEEALRRLIREIENRYPITKVSGHNEYSNKACPGFQVKHFLAHTKAPEPRTSVTQSKTIQASTLDIATKAGAGVTALAALEGTSQYIVLGFLGLGGLLTLFIMRERLKKWSMGIK